jgi:serine/threonine-protein kinase RsbT
VTTLPVVSKEACFPLLSDIDVAAARRSVRDWAKDLGLTMIDLTKVVTAASELARNAVIGGMMCLQIVQQHRRGLRVTFAGRHSRIELACGRLHDERRMGIGRGRGRLSVRLASTPSGHLRHHSMEV